MLNNSVFAHEAKLKINAGTGKINGVMTLAIIDKADKDPNNLGQSVTSKVIGSYDTAGIIDLSSIKVIGAHNYNNELGVDIKDYKFTDHDLPAIKKAIVKKIRAELKERAII